MRHDGLMLGHCHRTSPYLCHCASKFQWYKTPRMYMVDVCVATARAWASVTKFAAHLRQNGAMAMRMCSVSMGISRCKHVCQRRRSKGLACSPQRLGGGRMRPQQFSKLRLQFSTAWAASSAAFRMFWLASASAAALCNLAFLFLSRWWKYQVSFRAHLRSLQRRAATVKWRHDVWVIRII